MVCLIGDLLGLGLLVWCLDFVCFFLDFVICTFCWVLLERFCFDFM